MAPSVTGAADLPAMFIPALATSSSRSCRYRRKLACADTEKTTHRPSSQRRAPLLSCPMAVPTELTVFLSKRGARLTKSWCSSSGASRTVRSTHHAPLSAPPALSAAALPAFCGLLSQAPVAGGGSVPNRILAGFFTGDMPPRSSPALAILHTTLALPLPSEVALATPTTVPLREVAQL